MIYARPGQPRRFTIDGAPTGLAGQVGWRLENQADQILVARFTDATSEFATGAYRSKPIICPETQGAYVVVVDLPDGTEISIDLEVTYTAGAGPPGPGYTTIEDLRLALAPQGDQGPATAAALSDDELQDAIVEAGREVDARLGGRYTVPFNLDQAPPLVAQITRDLAAYSATLTHRRHHALADNHPVVLRYQAAKALLADLQTGKATLEGAGPAGEPRPSAEATVVNPYEGHLFGLEDAGIGPADRRWS